MIYQHESTAAHNKVIDAEKILVIQYADTSFHTPREIP